MGFSEQELEYLESQLLGRVATTSLNGEPDVAAVGFRLDGDSIVIDSCPRQTIKHRNVVRTGRASFIVDDLASVSPWRERGVKVTGRAVIEDRNGDDDAMRIWPETIWSWRLNPNAETYFFNVEKRPF